MPRSTKRSTATDANAEGNTTDLAADDVLVATAPLEAPSEDDVVKVEDPLAKQHEQHLHHVDQESALEA